MHPEVTAALEEALAGRDLPADRMQALVETVLDGACSDVELAALLTAWRVKGEAVSEIVGGVRALARRVAPVRTTRPGLLDTCGTGGDQLHTFNISTCVALVAAACGVPVAKHGNRGVSSSSGSADVLEALGVAIALPAATVGECLDELGIGFCFAPVFHGAMKHAAAVRKQLRFRTIFNLLGPLANPARAPFQLLGAPSPELALKLARAVRHLDRTRVLVVCGGGQLDEVALWSRTVVYDVEPAGWTQRIWTAESFGLPECRPEQLRVATPAESAGVIRRVLAGEPGPARDMVLANVAAALWLAGRCTDLQAGVQIAAMCLDAGTARALLERLAEWTQARAASQS